MVIDKSVKDSGVKAEEGVRVIVSASSPFVGFDGLSDNKIKGLTSLLCVKQKIDYIAYTWIHELVYDLKCIKGLKMGKLDVIPHFDEMKAKLYIVENWLRRKIVKWLSRCGVSLIM